MIPVPATAPHAACGNAPLCHPTESDPILAGRLRPESSSAYSCQPRSPPSERALPRPTPENPPPSEHVRQENSWLSGVLPESARQRYFVQPLYWSTFSLVIRSTGISVRA